MIRNFLSWLAYPVKLVVCDESFFLWLNCKGFLLLYEFVLVNFPLTFVEISPKATKIGKGRAVFIQNERVLCVKYYKQILCYFSNIKSGNEVH